MTEMDHRFGARSLLFLVVALFLAALPLTLAAEDVVHVVAKGETVYSISRAYKVSPDELMKHNGISDASKLQVGHRLKVPVLGTSTVIAATPKPAAPVVAPTNAADYKNYRVAKDDTLFSIARKCGISLQNLRDINGFSNDYVIKAGEVIKVPNAEGAPTVSGVVILPEPEKPGDIRQSTVKKPDISIRWPIMPRELAYMTGKLYGVAVLGERAEPVKSLIQGTVISAGPYRGFGKVAIVEVAGGYLYVYGGCESLSVREGDKIGPGTELGKLGVDAVSGKPQLFFLVYRGNAPVDPAKAPRA